ncbi:MAG: cyclohexa-1,5-dienecarbonyl-CoA hydratase [Proteobacteria bacterium]|nr:cyclohexa-1,5-dienecarbonyl-CoA hydratase [Pseudomonadota bacterium]
MLDSTSNYQKIKVYLVHDRQILSILLSSPPGNVLDGQMISEISACLEREAREKSVKAIVFEGEGKHFCFGASVAEHVRDKAPKMIHDFHGMFKKLLDCQALTIALVRGQCLGGGMELASFCNFIVAEPSAKFGQPEIQLGVLPPVAAAILPGIVGQQRADDLVLTGRSIDAHTACAWGLVHTVEEDGTAALEMLLTKHILPKSAETLRYANRAVRSNWYKDLSTRLDEMEHLYVNELMETEDANEGIEAFLEKRKPKWKNR